VRLDLLVHGRMPVTRALAEPWWSTPNIHLCTLKDFIELCAELNLAIEACSALSQGKPARAIDPVRPLENWRAESALFVLTRSASVDGRTGGERQPG
jgi:methionine biosynthesis protein MetW